MSANSPWLERPDLTEVKAVLLAQSKTGRKVVEFTLAVGIQRPRDKDAAAAAVKPGVAGTAGAAVTVIPAKAPL